MFTMSFLLLPGKCLQYLLELIEFPASSMVYLISLGSWFLVRLMGAPLMMMMLVGISILIVLTNSLHYLKDNITILLDMSDRDRGFLSVLSWSLDPFAIFAITLVLLRDVTGGLHGYC